MQFRAIVFACKFASTAPYRHSDTADLMVNCDEFAAEVVVKYFLHRQFYRFALFCIGRSIVCHGYSTRACQFRQIFRRRDATA
jgi:hypothetical protein